MVKSDLRHISMLSSEPSSQSGSPSHCHLLGMHWPLRHTKSTSAQEVSSLPSEQSRSPSHCHTDGMHRPQKEAAPVACYSQSCKDLMHKTSQIFPNTEKMIPSPYSLFCAVTDKAKMCFKKLNKFKFVKIIQPLGL
uniref:Uncharacterized protein n=1 Tax=Cyprinus carpio TaxID=7962 RepID=A0A8C1KVH0_CYPCA